MVRGELRALGPSQSLKSQHGAGYQVTVRVGAAAVAASGGSLDRTFQKVSAVLTTLSSDITEEPSGTVVKRYEVPADDADLATIFELLNSKADELGIVDFSVTQTTLEDVFLKFARMQK